MSAIVSRTFVIAAAAALALPTVASAKKAPVVIVPASLMADPAAKVCMPRGVSPLVAKDKTLPQTLCQTVDAWAVHGVTIRAK